MFGGFANPWVLGALAAAAIPLWLHLVARETPGGQPFPSLMFAKRVAAEVPRSRRLRDRWLLLARLLALAAIVLAFAQPPWPGPESEATASSQAETDAGASAVIVALDISGSMGSAGRFESAKSIATAILDESRGASRHGLLVFDREARWLVWPDRRSGPAEIRRALANLETGHGATRIGPALWATQRMLEAEQLRGVLHLVSDFPADAIPAANELPRAPGFSVEVHPVQGTPGPNLAVTGIERVTGESAGDAAGQFRGRVDVTVVNTGDGASQSAGIALTSVVAGSAAAGARQFKAIPALPGNGRATLTFDVDLPRDAPVQIEARLTGASPQTPLTQDGFAADNLRRAVLTFTAPLKVVLDTPVTMDRQAPQLAFIRSALAVAPYPSAQLLEPDADATLQAILGEADALVSIGTGSRLNSEPAAVRAFIEEGGQLLAIGQSGAGGLARGWTDEASSVLAARPGGGPVTLDSPVRLIPTAAAATWFSIEEPSLRSPVDDAIVTRFVPVTPATGSTVLFQASQGQPLLVERAVGRGRSVFLASGLSADASNLGLSPGFATWLHAALTGPSGPVAEPIEYPVGEPIAHGSLLDTAHRADGQEGRAASVLVEGPDDQVLQLEAGARSFLPARPGFYELTADESGTAQARRLVLAANLPAAESLANAGDAAALGVLTNPPQRAQDSGPASSEIEGSIANTAMSPRTTLWWLTLALCLLLLESILAPPGRVPREVRA